VRIGLNASASTGFSLGKGWRNPSEFELFANGPHDGVALYERGNPQLREETSLNVERTLRFDHGRARGAVAVFRNNFKNYVYPRLTGEVSGGLPVSVFAQGDAHFCGLEGQLDFDPVERLTLMVAGETLRTRNEATGTRLPFTPPGRQNTMPNASH